MAMHPSTIGSESTPKPKPKRASSPEKIAANRANSLKSTGPKTAEGKDRSRFNRLVHGLRAEVAVIPGEDPQELERRIAVWTIEMGAETEAECSLVETAVQAVWRMERCRKVEAAALTKQMTDVEENFDDRRAVEVSRLADQLDDDPAEVVRQLRQTVAGCRWLVGQWELLAANLDERGMLERSQKVRAIHLLGKRLGDLGTDPVVRAWVAADLGTRHGGTEIDFESVLGPIWQDRPEDMTEEEYLGRLRRMVAGLPDRDEALSTLQSLIVEVHGDLIERAALLEARDERDRALAVKCAAFDATPAGASRLRYEMSFERSLHASLRDLRACRKERASDPALAPTEANSTEVEGLEGSTLTFAGPPREDVSEDQGAADGVASETADDPTEADPVEDVAPTEAKLSDVKVRKEVGIVPGDVPAGAGETGTERAEVPAHGSDGPFDLAVSCPVRGLDPDFLTLDSDAGFDRVVASGVGAGCGSPGL
jgi:hypothetical protein